MAKEKEFFDFINERHAIYLRKEAGEPKPWTKDPILQEWKFCNVFRRLDRTSDWLTKNVIDPHQDEEPSDLLFNIFVFRAFNKIETYQLLGWSKNWDHRKVTGVLKDYVAKGNTLISGAYMIRGYQGQSKAESIPLVLEAIYDSKRSLLDRIRGKRTLENAFGAILFPHYWGWGEFTSYQVALDLTYSPILSNPPDIDTWCAFGPGAIRGLSLMYSGAKEKEYLHLTRTLLDMAPSYIGEHVPKMNLQDIEFSLCEFSKYERIKQGGRGKTRYEQRSNP